MRMPAQPGIVYVHYWAGLMMRRFVDTAEDAIDIVLKVRLVAPHLKRCRAAQSESDLEKKKGAR